MSLELTWHYSDQDFDEGWKPWQSEVAGLLGRRYLDASLHSGLLLRGSQGLGKRAFAKLFSATLLCDRLASQVSKADGGLFDAPLDSSALVQACGECASCQLLKAGTHPDIHLLMPEDGKKAISVDQVRDLIEVMQKTPQVASNKLAVIDPADLMNENASNALLKVLEEPSQNSYFILVADHFERLLPTIRSRCFSQAFAIPDKTQVIAYFKALGSSQADIENLWQKHRGFIQYLVDDLAGRFEESSLKALMLDFVSSLANGKSPSSKLLLNAVDKDSLSQYARDCVALFSKSDEAVVPCLTHKQRLSLFDLSVRLEKSCSSNPLAKLAVSDYLADCRQVIVA